MTEIEVYSKSNCPHCEEVRQFMIDQQLPFREIKLDDDAARQIFTTGRD